MYICCMFDKIDQPNKSMLYSNKFKQHDLIILCVCYNYASLLFHSKIYNLFMPIKHAIVK